ncbi:Alpha/Beta hydrolase protein [Flagelloscypha sp. PMI_526]|nr:Alpha/Beta hydrolase protein [Flagelloscypha sp. PMI_526]
MFSKAFYASSLLGGALAATLPVVDVGYARYQAANITGKEYYTFSNIRYAAPPVGNLRWRAPQPPSTNRSNIIQTSPEGNIAWYNNASVFLKDHLGPFAPQLNAGPLLLDPSQPTPDLDPRTSEDCLVLDLFAPKHLFDHHGHAPVLVWIHGGGFSTGSKDAFLFTPEGLYNASQSGFVAVSINYRLGAFLIVGFLAGSQVEQHGILNPGLLDQRFALEWVRTHYAIELGIWRDPWASYEDIIRANLLLIGNASPYPSFPVLPVADGSFIPAPPAELFSSGRYAHGLRILTGHNLDEGLMFTNPIAADETSFLQLLHELFPSATNDAFKELLVHYPSTFDGSLPYTSQITRAALTIGDMTFNSAALATSCAKEHAASFAYFFTAYPAIHAQDLAYAFYTPESPACGGRCECFDCKSVSEGTG